MNIRRFAVAGAAAVALVFTGASSAQAAPIDDSLLQTRVNGAVSLPCVALKAGNELDHKFVSYSDAYNSIVAQGKQTSLPKAKVHELAKTYANRYVECKIVKADLASGSSQFLGGSSDVIEGVGGLFGSS
ncbi:hypothetical protein [Corynebacterium aquilae]|uniref:Uncharacterized protein n=1 Tax=Corynebacterium aquilae DSM 44791 TaxID=1431546 RepID=A0A1L7CHD7_9CORY|nr:hypothetical protein [Corynebacterium aquilae]APT85239.1 hypothetical protein CAQU_09325 [Corynebacterium aquilae DSM 44791]